MRGRESERQRARPRARERERAPRASSEREREATQQQQHTCLAILPVNDVVIGQDRCAVCVREGGRGREEAGREGGRERVTWN